MAKRIYNRIKAVLAEKSFSSKELAEALNVAEGTVSRWCTNTRQPSIEMLFEIAETVKCDVPDLLVVEKKSHR